VTKRTVPIVTVTKRTVPGVTTEGGKMVEQMKKQNEKRLRSGLRWVLFGFLFQFLDFVIDEGGIVFDFIPDSIGWILILVGVLKLSPSLRKRVPIILTAVVLLIGDLVITYAALSDPRSSFGELDYFFGVASILFDGMFLWLMKDIAKKHQNTKRVSSIRKIMVFYLAVRAGSYVTMAGHIENKDWLGILVVASTLALLMFLYQILALGRELKPGKAPGSRNPAVNVALSVILCFALITAGASPAEGISFTQTDDGENSMLAIMDTSQYNMEWIRSETEYVLDDDGKKIGYLICDLGVARIKGTDDYVAAIRTLIGPEKTMIGDSEYGLNEYLYVKATGPMLDNYTPVNLPSSSSSETVFARVKMRKLMGIGIEFKNDSPDVERTVESCTGDESKYAVEYDYTPSRLNPFGNNKMFSNERIEYGEFSFVSEDEEVTITLDFDVRFGVAGDKDRSPWSIKKGKIYDKTVTQTHTFKIDKD